ncbi:hypothetical protein H4O14_09690 [Bacillus sp. PAMC26568]|nr:hypothetical protein H4O14_09690 [Bacillus sp. PAMC26568]
MNVKAKATIDESVKVVSLDTLKKEIKKKIKDDIRKTYENGMKIDADLYNLTASTYRSSPVLAKKYSLQSDLLSDIKIEVGIVHARSKK